MLGDHGSYLKEQFQVSGGGTKEAFLGEKGEFLHHLEVLPGSDPSLSWCTLIPLILPPQEVAIAFLWCFVMRFGELQLSPPPPQFSYCTLKVPHFHVVIPLSKGISTVTSVI